MCVMHVNLVLHVCELHAWVHVCERWGTPVLHLSLCRPHPCLSLAVGTAYPVGQLHSSHWVGGCLTPLPNLSLLLFSSCGALEAPGGLSGPRTNSEAALARP
jgi:hypothetical protein